MSLLDHFTQAEIDAQIDVPEELLAWLERRRQAYQYKQAYAREIARVRARAKSEVLLKLLDRQGVVLTGEQRETITACETEARVDLWIDRALSAKTAAELLG